MGVATPVRCLEREISDLTPFGFCLFGSGISTWTTLQLMELTGQCHGSYPFHQEKVLT